MKNNIDCRIVQDLLPSYVDGLASEYTNQVVEEHVKSCVPCNQMLQRMQEPEKRGESAEKEVDYMKKVRKKMSRLIAVSLISIGMFLLGVLACCLIYERVVPKNYQDVFVNDEVNYFIVNHPASGSKITLGNYEAEDLKGMLELGKYYYDGKEENIIEGDLFWVYVRGIYGQIYEFKITDKHKIYYDGKVYDVRDNKIIYEFLESKIQESQMWSDYEKSFYYFLDGKYVMKTDGDKTQVPTFEFDLENKTYSYLPSSYSSYREEGTFSISGQTVTLRGNHTFVFQIQDGPMLSFDAERSDELKNLGTGEPIKTGVKFIKE